MGLCSDLNDVYSDSIPLLLVAQFASLVCYLKSLLFCLLQAMGISRSRGGGGVLIGVGVGPFGAVGSGLSGLVLLAEQLNVHRVFTCSGSEGGSSDCVVCLCGLREGDQVRRLACRHVFHRECLDGWFDHQNLNCPLCRAPLATEQRVAEMERRVGGDLVTWFSPTR